MGILFFFFFLFFSRLFLKKKSTKYSKASTVALKYDLCQAGLRVGKLNFFKSRHGFKLSFKKNSAWLNSDILGLRFSGEKLFFFFLSLSLAFFKVSELGSSLTFFFIKKISEERLLWMVLQCFSIALPTVGEGRFFLFANLVKAFDFFFFRADVFSKVRSVVVPSFFELSGASASLTKSPILLFLKKTDTVFAQQPIISSVNVERYLYLVNNFFSKNKKFFFMRNNEIYNKSRYSRNRQTYRTGVFWCIWLTVLTVIGLYFYFYVFLIKFTYIWIFFFFFILSFFFYYFRSKVERHFFF